ncbi:MAG TPA: CBS domain-containing protein [Aestuariivirgaceae bacterium]|nr:CBS domain-containing protein [Aestuariivirgaceae bacterium]
MSVAAILKEKGTDVATAPGKTTLAEIAVLLERRRIGAVVITGPRGAIEGIVSERDIVSAVARSGTDVLNRPVSEVMTRAVRSCVPTDSIYELMNVMTEHRVRHLPVVVDGKLQGIVSIGDVVKQRIAEIEFEASEMKRYIGG